MPPRDPSRPQLDFPQLLADLIAQLQIRGQVGLLDFADSVQPVVIVAIRDGIGFQINQPVFQSAEVFDDSRTNPVLFQTHANTGPLVAGTYDVIAGFSVDSNTGSANMQLQLRDAPNLANLATWSNHVAQAGGVGNQASSFPLTMAIAVGVNESLRFQNVNAAGGGNWSSWIMAALRPAP